MCVLEKASKLKSFKREKSRSKVVGKENNDRRSFNIQ